MTRRVVAASVRAVIRMALFVVGASAEAGAQGHTHPPTHREIAAASVATSADSSDAMGTVPLFDGLGTFSRRGDTTDPTVQRYIDQGWRLAYGFAREAAVTSFAEAARRDSLCAMCWWGVAWAAGPYFNDPEPSAAALRRAAEAAARAWRLRARVRAGDRALIEAMHARFDVSDTVPRLKAGAYADALAAAYARFPEDDDLAALLGEARYLAHTGPLHGHDGRPLPGTAAVIAPLARVVERSPMHAGACHLFIHVVESGIHARDAAPCARHLTAAMPSASHMLHMPSHIWHRLGLWGEAVRANQLAVMADERARAGGPPAVYPQHNLRMLLAGAVMDGQSAVALAAAQRIAAALPTGSLLVPMVQARFGRFDEVRRAAWVTGSSVATAWSAVLAGLADLAAGDQAAARRRLALVDAVAAAVSPDATTQEVADSAWIRIARGILAGELLAADGDVDGAVVALSASVRAEDALPYAEHPTWLLPARHVLAGVLLDAQRHAEALAVLCRDLEVQPRNGWALTGIVRALHGIPGTPPVTVAAADAVRADAWQRADVWIDGPRVAPRRRPGPAGDGILYPGRAIARSGELAPGCEPAAASPAPAHEQQ